MIVAFCGHRSISDRDDKIKCWLVETVEDLIKQGATQFYLGEKGQFDQLAKNVVWALKDKYPHVKSTLVLAYLNGNEEISKYDDTIYPPIENTPRRYAISKRNEWMVQESDIVVAYVLNSCGGAAKTLEVARRRKKRVVKYELT